MAYTHKSPPVPTRISRMWTISGTVPNPEPPEKDVYYNCNFSVGVEAPTIESAIASARNIFPTASFTSINHKGDVHIKTDQS